MATFSYIISVFLLAFFVSIASSDSSDDLTKSINQFSTHFFKEMSDQEALGDQDHGLKNLFTSSLSTHIMLTLLSLGAKGQTLQDMNKGLFITDKVKDDYMEAIIKMKTYMHLSDKLYVQLGNALNPEFQKNATVIFESLIENTNFSNGEGAATEINAWVETNTAMTINNFVKVRDLNNQTTVVPVNTVLYEGLWKNPFNPLLTKKEDFFLENGTVILVDTMHQLCQTNYAEDTKLKAQILQLDFNVNNLSMVFILPNKKNGLKELEKNLINTDMEALVKSLKSEEVFISLPKFQIKTAAYLQGPLSHLNFGIIFSKDADFGGVLANGAQLKVNDVSHKSYIDLNELGVTTSGAIGEYAEEENSLMNRKIPKGFKANHPYYFALFNGDYQIIFSGHFTGVNATGSD